MKTAALFLILTCLMVNSNAQKNIAGEYYLHGVMEVASGIKLNADSSFEFYFSYGALDRYGKGVWSLKDDSVILKSASIPGKDFKLANSVASTNKFSTIKIEDKNTDLYQMIYCLAKSGDKDSVMPFDETGTINLPFVADSIIFLSDLCSERFSAFQLDKSIMVYTFNIQPWILEVFFNETALHFTDDYLEGKHPLLDEKIYRFEKEKASDQ